MKKLTATFGLFLLFVATSFAQEAAAIETAGGPEMTFEAEVIDYGTINQHDNGVRTFKFTNTGSAPLIISRAKGSCGCTVPTWPKKPINPGEAGEIKVKYATDRLGPINKSVTVTTNAKEPTTVLRIKGNVVKKETSPVKKASEMTPTAG